MMKNYNGIESIIEEYINLSTSHWNASRVGDYKTVNNSYTKLKRIFKILQNDEQLSKEMLLILLNNSSFCVQLWAASHCLALGIYLDEALMKLEQISKLEAKVAPSFEAKMTLKVWRENGVLNF